MTVSERMQAILDANHPARTRGKPAPADRAAPATRPSPAPSAAGPAVPDCLHLGSALPNQPGCGCRERVRDCDVYGVCSLRPAKVERHCQDAAGRVVCPSYEPKE